MYGNNLDADKLGIRDLVGEPTGNALINWVKGLATTSNYLYVSPNSRGSIDLDFNFALVANTILGLVGQMASEFRASVSGSVLTIDAGHVILPGSSVSIPRHVRTLSGGNSGKTVCLTTDASDSASASGAQSWEYEVTSFPNGIVSGTVVRLPVCTVTRSGGVWGVLQIHLGAFIFAVPPAPLVPEYHAAKKQSLDHSALGTLEWTDYAECEE